MTYTLTGNTAYRLGFMGRVILQVEVSVRWKRSSYRRWKDATACDLVDLFNLQMERRDHA